MMANENSNLLQLERAMESARKEVEIAERVLQDAEDVHNKVKAIPKGKAGGGKKAKSEASKNYQDAKNDIKEKKLLLKVAQKRLANFSSGLATVSFVDTTEDGSKRPEDAVPVETMSPMKKQCIDDTHGTDLELHHGSQDPSTIQEPGSFIIAQAEGPQAISNRLDVPIAPLGPSGPDIGLNAQNSPRGPQTISNTNTPAPNPSFRNIEKDRSNIDVDNGSVPFGDSDFDDEQLKTDDELADKADVDMHASEEPNFSEGNDDSDSGISDLSGPGTEVEYDEDLPDYPSDTGSESKDEVRREKAKKYKHVDLNEEEKELYRFMTDRDKKKLTNKGLDAIKKFVQKGESISTTIRRMARTDPTFLPEAATTSRTVAIHFLTSKDGNIQCGYHAFKNKTTCARDGWGKEGMKIRGMPGKRSLSRKNNIVKPPAKGLGNCGCRIDDILLEFFLSKCLSIDSMIGGKEVSEMMMGVQDYMEPRDRSFAFQAIRFLSPFFSLDDFFHHGCPPHQEMKIAKKYAGQSLDILNTMYRKRVPEGEVDLSKEFVLISKAKLLQLEEKVKMLRQIDEVSRGMDL